MTRVYNLDWSNGSTGFDSQSAAVLRAFGTAREVPGRRRMIKDVLRVGTFHVGPGAWKVEPQTLVQMAANFAKRKQRGHAVNLVKTHGDAQSKVVHPDDILLDIDDVRIVGDEMYVSAYVDDEQHRYLSNPALKVSIRAADRWMDGDGQKYGTCLLHVAVVDQPIMGGQQPFRELANGGAGMDPLIEAVNMLLSALGKEPLPDTVTVENLPDVLKGMAVGMGGSGETESEPDLEAPVIDTTEADPAMADMSATIKQLSARLEKFELRDGQAAFHARCDELGKAGVPAKAIEAAKVTGKSLRWDLSILTPLESVKVIDMSRQSKGGANPDAPEIPGETKPKKTPEEIKEAAKSFR